MKLSRAVPFACALVAVVAALTTHRNHQDLASLRDAVAQQQAHYVERLFDAFATSGCAFQPSSTGFVKPHVESLPTGCLLLVEVDHRGTPALRAAFRAALPPALLASARFTPSHTVVVQHWRLVLTPATWL